MIIIRHEISFSLLLTTMFCSYVRQRTNAELTRPELGGLLVCAALDVRTPGGLFSCFDCLIMGNKI
jgi:hypothetical protein